MPTINSYKELNLFFLDLERYLNANGCKPISALARATIGCFLVSNSTEKLQKFSSNRYFIDAINISEIPKIEDLKLGSIIKEIGEIFNIDTNALNKNPHTSLRIISGEIVGIIWNKKNHENYGSSFWTSKMQKFFYKNGYVVVPNFFNPEKADLYRKELYQIADQEKKEGTAFLYGYENSGQRVYNLINKTSIFDNLLSSDKLDFILKDLFKRQTLHQLYMTSSWHANFLKSGAAAQVLHSDLALPDPLPKWTARINVNFILEDYTLENGATQCIPGSHLFFRQPTELDTQRYEKKLKTITAKKGSLVIWTGHLWHRSGQNKSRKTRVAALACYAASFLLELAMEENHPTIISKKRKITMPNELADLFGLSHGIK